jgi:hypothetical protein
MEQVARVRDSILRGCCAGWVDAAATNKRNVWDLYEDKTDRDVMRYALKSNKSRRDIKVDAG